MTWADISYGYKKKITIDHTQVTADVVDFPMLISVTDADLKDTANGGHVESSSGYDIVFYDSNETSLLSHEIDTYAPATGAINFWVNTILLSSVNDTVIYMYYGKPAVLLNPSSTNTWNANYVLVNHFNEAAGNIIDSTANAHTGTPKGPIVYQQPGKFAIGLNFSGLSTGIDYGDHDDFSPLLGQTISLWIKQALVNVSRFLISKEQAAGAEFSSYSVFNGLLDFYIRGTGGGYIGRRDANGGSVLEGGWHKLDLVWTGGTTNASILIYIDGVQTDDVNYGAGLFTARKNTTAKLALATDLFIDPPNGTYDWKGNVDEFHFTNNGQVVGWIRTEFNNQSSPATFMSFDVEESLPVIIRGGMPRRIGLPTPINIGIGI